MEVKKYFPMLLMIFTMFNMTPIGASAENNIDMIYEVAESEGNALFHLDTSLVTYTSDELEKNITYHITTQKGNYYYGNGYKNYNVYIEDDVLRDIHGNNVELGVTFNCNQAQGILNLNNTIEDVTTYNGHVIATTESTDVAGLYKNNVTVEFLLENQLTKLATNKYTIYRGVTPETNYVEIPGIQNGTSIAELRNNFLNKEGEIKVYDANGNVINDDNTIISTAMTIQLENIPTGISTFGSENSIINDSLRVVIPGDIDGDGEITGADMGIIADWLLKADQNWIYKTAADINKDGKITTLDSSLCGKLFRDLNVAKIDEPFLYSTRLKTQTYNGIKYVKGKEQALVYEDPIAVFLRVNEHQYDETIDEEDEWIAGITDEQRFKFKKVLYSVNDEIINSQSDIEFATGMKYKIVKAYYDENGKFLYNGDYYYDTLTYILDGDINCDGLVNEEDIAYLTQAINGETTLTTIQRLAADRNNDGIINQDDITIYNA